MGEGYIVIVKLIVLPTHPLRVGVTVIVPTTFDPARLGGAVQAGILPLPLAPRPILMFELTQLSDAPIGELTKFPKFI